MAITLTTQFDQAIRGYGRINSFGLPIWQTIVSLLNTAEGAEGQPLKLEEKNINGWRSLLMNEDKRESGLAIATMFGNFSRNKVGYFEQGRGKINEGKDNKAEELISVCPLDILLAKMLAEAVRVMPKMTPSSLKNILISVAYLAINPGEEFLEALEKALQDKASIIDKNCGVMVLQGLAVLDAVLAHNCGEDRYPIKRIYDNLMKNPAFVAKIGNYPDSVQINIMIDAELWFTGTTKDQYKFIKEGTVSPLENEVAHYFSSLGIEVHQQVEIPGVNHPLDLSLIYQRATCHCELDGKTHFVMVSDGQSSYVNGQTLYQSALIQIKEISPLVRVPSMVFTKKRGDGRFWSGFREMMADIPDATANILLEKRGEPSLIRIGRMSPPHITA